MKPQVDMDKIAKALSAHRRGKVAASGGYFGAMQVLADVKAKFPMRAGGGRPTNPRSTERRAAPSAPSPHVEGLEVRRKPGTGTDAMLGDAARQLNAVRSPLTLRRALADKFGLSQVDAKRVVQGTFATLIDTLFEHGRIELRNFGVFEVKTRKPRKARNPRTGEEVFVPEKRVVTFKPGRLIEERITGKSR